MKKIIKATKSTTKIATINPITIKKRGRPAAVKTEAVATPAAKRGRPAKVVAPIKKRGRPAAAKAEAVVTPAAKRGRPAKVVAPIKKRGRPGATKTEAVVAPAAKRGRPLKVKVITPIAAKSINTIPDVMPQTIRTALTVAMDARNTPKAHKTIIRDALASTEQYRFTTLHDVVRQTVRNAAIKHLHANGDRLNATARLFGIASASLKKWRDEETQGINNIRARGRPEGKKNEYRTIIHDGKDIKVRIEDTESVTRMSNGIPRTEYRLKKGIRVG